MNITNKRKHTKKIHNVNLEYWIQSKFIILEEVISDNVQIVLDKL